MGHQLFEDFRARRFDRIHAQIERRAFFQRIDQRRRIVVLPLDLRKQPLGQLGLHRGRRVCQIDCQRMLHRLRIASQRTLIDRIETVLARQRQQRGKARRARRMRWLHQPSHCGVAAQRKKHRLGNQATVALTE